MGRRLLPLDPADGPKERFACELRALRAISGDLPFWKMAKRCSISKSTLAAAVAGRQMPSERVTREFVRVCGGDWSRWRERWLQAVAELERAECPLEDAERDSECGGALVPVERMWLLSAGTGSRSRLAVETRGDLDTYPAGGDRRRRRRKWVVVGVLAAVAAFAGGWAAGHWTTNGTTSPHAPAAIVVKDGQDPYVHGCGSDQVPLERQPIYRSGGTFYGWVVLYSSTRCSAEWAYVIGPNSPQWTVHASTHRMRDNATANSDFRGEARPNSWANVLSVRPGCVRAEAWIDAGPHAVTSCWAQDGPVTHP